MTINLIQTLETLGPESASIVLKDIETQKLKQVYCECVDRKKNYKRAYSYLLEELNKREDLN
jgi:hypothetical protein